MKHARFGVAKHGGGLYTNTRDAGFCMNVDADSSISRYCDFRLRSEKGTCCLTNASLLSKYENDFHKQNRSELGAVSGSVAESVASRRQSLTMWNDSVKVTVAIGIAFHIIIWHMEPEPAFP